MLRISVTRATWPIRLASAVDSLLCDKACSNRIGGLKHALANDVLIASGDYMLQLVSVNSLHLLFKPLILTDSLDNQLLHLRSLLDPTEQ